MNHLIVFIKTFAKVNLKDAGPVGSGNLFCVLWHEVFRGRGADNIVDFSLITATSERHVKSLIFLMDNCSGRNKNWVLYTALITNSEPSFWAGAHYFEIPHKGTYP